MQQRCPPLEPVLLDYLEAVFPDQAVDPKIADPSQYFGRQEVIRHLRSQLQQQEEATYVRT